MIRDLPSTAGSNAGLGKWMCMPDKNPPRLTGRLGDNDASLLWFDAKSSFLPKNRRKLLYQRTTGSSKRITMCSTNIHGRTQMHLINSGGAHHEHRAAQIVQSNKTAGVVLLRSA